jgi:organic radical activating enzyme
MTEIKNYYCSQKFDWVEIRLYDGFVASCCQAQSHRITVDDIKNHPVGFFNYSQIQKERQQMLDNQPVSGCETGCWSLERQNIQSRRQRLGADQKIYSTIEGIPKTLNLVVNNTCLQSCVYCCKNFSSSWLADVVKNGNYDIPGYENRYNASSHDKVLSRISQPELHNSKFSQTVLDQIIKNSDQVEHLVISGGEPLLDNNLVSLLQNLSHVPKITVYSGLTVNTDRLQRILDSIKSMSQLEFVISAENIDALHEFNRYGSKQDLFDANVDIIKLNFSMQFSATVSNATLFGLPDFLNKHSADLIKFNLLVDPGYLAPNILDNNSKQVIVEKLQATNRTDLANVINYIMLPIDAAQKPLLKQFLDQYSTRRGMDLKIFPESWIQWMQ